MRRVILALIVLVLTCQAAPADFVPGYAVFGNGNVFVNSNVTGGQVGSNASVTLGSFVTVDGASGGLDLLNSLGSSTINGPVTFNRDVLTGGITYNGPINAGRDVSLGAFYQSQDITAGRNVTLSGGFSATNGNVLAGGNFTLTTFGQVNGNVTAKGTITNQGTITETQTANFAGSVTPKAFTPVQLPAPANFTPGTTNVTGGGALAPGSYGNVEVTTFNTLTLSAGTYYLKSLTLDGSSNLQLDLSKGPISIFVQGDYTENSFVNITVKGPTDSTFQPILINNAPNAAEESLAAQVFLETLGNVNDGFGSGGNPFGGNFFGTLYAPEGNINTQFATVIGSLIAGGNVNVNTFSPVYYVESNFQAPSAVPEPTSLTLLGIGAAGLAGYAWRRNKRAAA